MLRPVRKTIQGLHEFIEQGDEPSADIMQASTYQDLMLSLKGYVATQELSEARRLLYVLDPRQQVAVHWRGAFGQ